jgi:hypothetical protein
MLIYFVKETEGELKHITVNRLGGNSGTVSVQYFATAEGSATIGSDYTGASGTLTWADGDSEPKSLSVTILEDEALENAETVHFKLFDATGSAELDTPTEAKLIIVDNEGEPLPSLGKGSAIPCQPDECDITAVFKGGARFSGPDYQATLSISPSELVSIIGEIEVDAAHVDQKADILVVFQAVSETERFWMVDNQQHLQEWGLEPATLKAVIEDLQLTATQPVALYQGVLTQALANLGEKQANLLIYFGYRFEEGLIVFNGEQPINLRVEQDKLPSLGQGMAILCPLEDCGPVNTRFKGGASVEGQDLKTTLTLSPTQQLSITGEIAVSANHIGSTADILIVAGFQPVDAEQMLWFMVDTKPQALAWDGLPSTLKAAQKDVTLTSIYPIAIYQGGLGEGKYLIYFGYRLEDGMAVFNGEQAIEVRVEQAQ